jgi:hypothetical protein
LFTSTTGTGNALTLSIYFAGLGSSVPSTWKGYFFSEGEATPGLWPVELPAIQNFGESLVYPEPVKPDGMALGSSLSDATGQALCAEWSTPF